VCSTDEWSRWGVSLVVRASVMWGWWDLKKTLNSFLSKWQVCVQ
jgi:hypothetical protein